MRYLSLLAATVGTISALEDRPDLFSNPVDTSKIPTSYESAVMGRRILALTKLATLSTIFPDSHSSGAANDDDDVNASERRPAGLEGTPIGLMDYVANCEDDGNPTILAINIATSFKNARDGSNISLSMRWTPPHPPSKRISLFSQLTSYLTGSFAQDSDSTSDLPDTVPYSAANLPRFSLIGYLEPIKPGPVDTLRLAGCFTKKHPDAKYWLPGNAIHESEWVRLVVTQVYWIGGFGDRAYIGWIPVGEWRNVTKEEWTGVKLPGEEKGWKEWSVGGDEL